MNTPADPRQPHPAASTPQASNAPAVSAATTSTATSPQSLQARKAALRAEMRTRRDALTEAQLDEANALIARQVERLIQVTGARRAAAYLPTPREPGGTALIELLYARLDALFLPLCLSGGLLEWAEFNGWEHLRQGPHGILEPTGSRKPGAIVADCDLFFVPALAVTPQGFRLGQGGGYYDRALAGLVPGAPPRVAVVFDHSIVPSIPLEDHDAPVDVVLTPSTVFSVE